MERWERDRREKEKLCPGIEREIIGRNREAGEGRVSKGKKVFWVRIKKGIRINQSQRDISGMSFFSRAYISGT